MVEKKWFRRVFRWPRSRRPWLFWPLVAGGVVLVAVEVFQLSWPRDQFLWGQQIDNISVGTMTTNEATEALQQRYMAQKVAILNDDDETIAELSPVQLGLTINSDEQVEEAADYRFWQRAIPFSFIWRMTQNPSSAPQLAIADASELVAAPAVNASLAVENGALKLTPAAVGYEFDANELRASLANLRFSSGEQPRVNIAIVVLTPAIDTETAETIEQRVTTAIGDGLSFEFDDKTFPVARAAVLDWLTFTNDEEERTIIVTADRDRLEQSFAEETISGQIAITPTPTIVDTLNGRETGRKNGTDGRALNYDEVLATINARLAGDGDGAIRLAAVTVASPVQFNRSYTPDLNGLNAELADKFAGKAFAVSVVNLATGQPVITVNSGQVFTAASTYKLYIAYSMLKAVEAGDAKWSDPLNGTTLDECFDRMIVNSDNACPEAWIAAKGLPRLEAEARAAGATGTTTFRSFDMRTTASDLTNFLTNLYKGNILKPASTSRLIEVMKRQVFRQGIPAGIGGNGVVADKVGFLGGLLHDAGIIYTGKGDFVMVIMTDASSWGAIAETAGAIYARL